MRRQALADESIRDVPIHPVSIETVSIAGRIEGDQAAQGVVIAFEDLLIAATALQLGNRRCDQQCRALPAYSRPGREGIVDTEAMGHKGACSREEPRPKGRPEENPASNAVASHWWPRKELRG